MPFEIRKQDNKFCVFTQGTDHNHGCHPDRKSAIQQLRALYANVPDASKARDPMLARNMRNSDKYQAGVGQGNGGVTPNSGVQQNPQNPAGGYQQPLSPATTVVGQYLPYTDAEDPNLPEDVRALPDLKRRNWVSIWNNTYKRCRDQGGADECETVAYNSADQIVYGKQIKRFNGPDRRGNEKAIGESHTSSANTTSSSEPKMSQVSAEYRANGGNDAMACSNCFWFQSPSKCHVVQGTISPGGLSSLWTSGGALEEDVADKSLGGLDESTLGLLVDWAHEHPEDAEELVVGIVKDRGAPNGGYLNEGTSDIFDGMGTCHCAACEAVDDELVGEKGTLGWFLVETKAKLTYSARNKLSKSQFAYVDNDGKGHFPIHDAAHVRNALARLSQSPFGSKAKPKVCAAAKRMGVESETCGSADKSFKGFVKALFNNLGGTSPCASCDDVVKEAWSGGGLALFKDKEGQLRIYARFSNNFKDHHREIMSEAAHKDYELFTDKTGIYPEFWLWHTKGTRWGKADLIAYSDNFMHAFGTVDPGCEDIARKAVERGDALSHGFLTFDSANGVINRYRTWEISTLPRGTEANPWFTGVDLVKSKELEMAIPEAKRAYMRELGVPTEMIKAIEEEAEERSSFLKEMRVESKAVDKPKGEAGVAGQAKRKRPTQLNTAVGKDDNDNDAEPDDDEDDKPTRTNSKEFTVDAKDLMRGMLMLSAQLKELSEEVAELKAARTPEAAKEESKPAAKSLEEEYMELVGRAPTRAFVPTSKETAISKEEGREIDRVLGSVSIDGKQEGPNSWFGDIVQAVEKAR